ncbi:G-type lectin S-receptor-like serine/threonine-protein kinase At4g27290 isoform X2 [Daucus carota subsp. sativus]|uniref:G-type lectin S-receptor-like serine/threonine-protein kinase At4g27290 isoform X2 n=1 Tax=Daucus carota subsp. sativus TaxID=79200 RepID=UPI003082B09C
MEMATIILLCCTLLSTLRNSMAVDTIRAHQAIRDGETITSSGGEFELGFFSPGMARVDDKGITLKTDDGIIWSSNMSLSMKNPVAQLLDSGNLVLRDDDHDTDDNFIWQSFDYPGDNLLPGMKLGFNLVTGLDWLYTSWKSIDDPSTGIYIDRVDRNGFPQVFLLRGSVNWHRFGPYNGRQFSGAPFGIENGFFTEKFVISEREVYYKFNLIKETSAVVRYTLTPQGETKILVWNYQNQTWNLFAPGMVTGCDRYGLCGAYGICNINSSPVCECLTGFVPKSQPKWTAEGSSGCVRREKINCSSDAIFMKYSGVKLPDTRHSWYDMKTNLAECGRLCLQNCSCTAYANADIRRGGSGCILWFNDLIDMMGYTEDGQDIYVKMPASKLESGNAVDSQRPKLIVLVPVVLLVVAVALAFLYVSRRRRQKAEENLKLGSENVALNKTESEDWDLPLVDFKKIVNATDNFSLHNKLGEGGFGLVYKGILEDGQEIAVKRLSKNSDQGLDEFINEVSFIAKLQHRNLVALVGCCTEKGERILIYEYMANKSLDSFIFDEETRRSMDWLERFKIINGIAKGLLYLHEDSKLRIIHRDLKASNILLDHEMNPKISDFGMARCFEGSQIEAYTSRIVGTYGYMSPEYAIDGQFSVKSDVYSFGVLLIEIVSGQKNRLFTHPDHSLNLLGHAWNSYNDDKLLEVIDEVMLESCNLIKVFRVIHIGLLCVQEDPVDRPDMSAVVLMLSSDSKLAYPKKPGFFMERKLRDRDPLLSNPYFSSCNKFSITSIVPRQ